MEQEIYYLTQAEASQVLKISVRTLERMRVDGTGPQFCKAGRRVLYRFEDVKDWVDQSVRRSTSDQPVNGPIA